MRNIQLLNHTVAAILIFCLINKLEADTLISLEKLKQKSTPFISHINTFIVNAHLNLKEKLLNKIKERAIQGKLKEKAKEKIEETTDKLKEVLTDKNRRERILGTDNNKYVPKFAPVLYAEQQAEQVAERFGKPGEFIEGDIKKSSFDKFEKEGFISKREVLLLPKYRWEKAQIPYTLDPSLSVRAKNAIESAMEDFKRFTCVRFHLRLDEPDYINFVKKNGCWSSIGRQGGKQDLSIGTGCAYKGSVLHEIMHAMGLFHEHTRPDRDDYIRINYQNVEHGKFDDFRKYSNKITSHFDFPYDYDSLTHYGPRTFSKDFISETIEALHPDRQDASLMGQRSGFSILDAKQINKIFCEKNDVALPLPSTTTPGSFSYPTMTSSTPTPLHVTSFDLLENERQGPSTLTEVTPSLSSTAPTTPLVTSLKSTKNAKIVASSNHNGEKISPPFLSLMASVVSPKAQHKPSKEVHRIPVKPTIGSKVLISKLPVKKNTKPTETMIESKNPERMTNSQKEKKVEDKTQNHNNFMHVTQPIIPVLKTWPPTEPPKVTTRSLKESRKTSPILTAKVTTQTLKETTSIPPTESPKTTTWPSKETKELSLNMKGSPTKIGTTPTKILLAKTRTPTSSIKPSTIPIETEDVTEETQILTSNSTGNGSKIPLPLIPYMTAKKSENITYTSTCGEKPEYPCWPADYLWTFEGLPYDCNCKAKKSRICTCNCVQFYGTDNEDVGWSNNYLCYRQNKANPNLQWSIRGAIPGMKCVHITEPEEPSGWKNNYLCMSEDAPYNMVWSSNGSLSKRQCIQIYEPHDKVHGWGNNYLCA